MELLGFLLVVSIVANCYLLTAIEQARRTTRRQCQASMYRLSNMCLRLGYSKVAFVIKEYVLNPVQDDDLKKLVATLREDGE